MQNTNELIKKLLESGVHFGHQTNRWNPKMARYIFGEKNGIYIIDLQKTVEGLLKAVEFIKNVASEGEYILFAGTKKQAQNLIKEHAVRCETCYVSERWLGGTLTNFKTIRQSVNRLEELERLKNSGTFELLSKKERAQISKELEKLIRNLEGIRVMTRLPGALFVIDPKNEETAVREANRLSIPVIALADTNADPDKIDYVIPGNDDAIKSIDVITKAVADVIIEGRQLFLKGKPPEEEKEKSAAGKSLKTGDEYIEKLIAGGIKEEVKEERIKKKPTGKKK